MGGQAELSSLPISDSIKSSINGSSYEGCMLWRSRTWISSSSFDKTSGNCATFFSYSRLSKECIHYKWAVLSYFQGPHVPRVQMGTYLTRIQKGDDNEAEGSGVR